MKDSFWELAQAGFKDAVNNEHVKLQKNTALRKLGRDLHIFPLICNDQKMLPSCQSILHYTKLLIEFFDLTLILKRPPFLLYHGQV